MMGCTIDTVIAATEANHPNLTNQKTLYVEIGRARAELVTDDAKALCERLEAATEERIAALEAIGGKPRHAERSNEAEQTMERRTPGTEKVRTVRGMEMQEIRYRIFRTKLLDRISLVYRRWGISNGGETLVFY